MKITILTLFPEMFSGPFDYSILKRAIDKKIVEIEIINIRDYGTGQHKVVDDTPYGGGIGMVLKVDVLHSAIESVVKRTKKTTSDSNQKIVLLSASGKPYKQAIATQYSKLNHLILICGHYEGVDERIIHYIDEEITIGDYVLTGGELPAMTITDSVIRLLDGAITKGAIEDESFSNNDSHLEYPHFTRPQKYEGYTVPEILLSGNHQEIAKWRRERSVEKTIRIRPDLIKKSTKNSE